MISQPFDAARNGPGGCFHRIIVASESIGRKVAGRIDDTRCFSERLFDNPCTGRAPHIADVQGQRQDRFGNRCVGWSLKLEIFFGTGTLFQFVFRSGNNSHVAAFFKKFGFFESDRIIRVQRSRQHLENLTASHAAESVGCLGVGKRDLPVAERKAAEITDIFRCFHF